VLVTVDDKDLGAIHSLTQLAVRGQADKGDWRGALEIYKSVLETKICVCGHEHPDVSASYNNIGLVYNRQGKYEEVIEYYQKDLDITVRLVGGATTRTWRRRTTTLVWFTTAKASTRRRWKCTRSSKPV